MISKHRFMALLISASMGLSMLTSPVAALAAEETPAMEETQEAVTEEAPSEEEPAVEAQEEAAPAEEVQDTVEEPAAEPEEVAPAEEQAETVNNAEETDEAVPAAAAEEAVTAEEVKAEPEPAVEAQEEEIKETAIEALQGVWEGEGIYSWVNTKTGALIGYRYMYTESKYHKGFKNVGSSQYYFDKNNGYLKTGWFTANGFKYYGSTVSSIEKGRGVLYTGMKVIGGHHYYFFVSTKDGHYGKTQADRSFMPVRTEKLSEALRPSAEKDIISIPPDPIPINTDRWQRDGSLTMASDTMRLLPVFWIQGLRQSTVSTIISSLRQAERTMQRPWPKAGLQRMVSNITQKAAVLLQPDGRPSAVPDTISGLQPRMGIIPEQWRATEPSRLAV